MRKLSLILIFIIFSFSLTGCEFLSWRKYDSAENKFSLKIPKSWEIDNNARDAALVMYIPKESPREQFVGNVRVLTEDLPAPIDLATYYDINREEFRQVFKKMGDISEGQGMTGLVRYQWIAFTAPLSEKLLIRAISVVWIKGKRVYIMTCVTDLRRFYEVEPIFRKMLASFRLH